jgi:DNA mismatch endonuclease, patch repair protein
MMSRVRGRENKAEVALRKALWHLGFRYKLQDRTLLGRPDIILPKYRAVIFVDGDFWHGRALLEGGEEALRQVIRGSRFEWWRDKLSRTIERDAQVTSRLQDDGWSVIRVWESDLITSFETTTKHVVSQLNPEASSRHRPLHG